MYLKMMLGGQLLEERPVQNENLYGGDTLQTTMTEMISRYEAEIELRDEQPQFILEPTPTALPKKEKWSSVFRRAAVFFKFLLS